MSSPLHPKPSPAPEGYPPLRRAGRALARRLPGLHRAYNRLRALAAHLPAKYGPRVGIGRLEASYRSVAGGLSSLRSRRSETRLTVGIDIAALWEPLTGIGWYLYRLLEHLADRDDVRLRLYGPTTVVSPDLAAPVVPLPAGPAIELVSREVAPAFLVPAGLVIRILRRLEPLLIALDDNDVLFAPNFFLPRRFRLARGERVTTVHDLGLRLVPETLRPETLAELSDRLEHQLFESSRIITVSAAVRDELVALGYAEPERVDVVHHGPGQLAAIEPGPLPAGVPERFALHVGTLEPRKNIGVLVETWRLLSAPGLDCPPLVLCGKYGWKAGPIRTAVESAMEEGWLLHLGYVADSELAALYRRAEVVVFPTLYEGFGLPAVEALWAGTPLVCSDLPVLRETTGGAALFAPHHSPSSFAECVQRVLADDDLRADLVERGCQRVRELSWNSSARLTNDVWRRAAGHSRAEGPA